MFNKNKLRGKLVEQGLTNADLAFALGINPATFQRKLSGETEWRRNELALIKSQLCLSAEEMTEIFFAPEIAETQEERHE